MAKALAPEVSTWPADNPQLIGSRCASCEAVTWPQQDCCPRCSSMDMSEQLLQRHGTLIAWTTQGFVPKLPYAGKDTAEGFEPFGIGLVQLGGDVRVETRLTTADPAELKAGMAMQLTFVPLYVDEAGDDIMTVAFDPVRNQR